MNLVGNITGDVNAAADLGHPTKMTAPTGSINFSGSTSILSLNSAGGLPFSDYFSIGDYLVITGADNTTTSSGSVDTNNRIIRITSVSKTGNDTIINHGQVLGSHSGDEPVFQKLIRGVFFSADDTIRIADGALSTGTKRKQRGYIKQTHFKDAE